MDKRPGSPLWPLTGWRENRNREESAWYVSTAHAGGCCLKLMLHWRELRDCAYSLKPVVWPTHGMFDVVAHISHKHKTGSTNRQQLKAAVGKLSRGNAALCEFWLQKYSVCIYIMLWFEILCGRVQRPMVKMLWLFKYLWTQLNYRVIMRSAHSLELAVGKHCLYHLRWIRL